MGRITGCVPPDVFRHADPWYQRPKVSVYTAISCHKSYTLTDLMKTFYIVN